MGTVSGDEKDFVKRWHLPCSVDGQNKETLPLEWRGPASMDRYGDCTRSFTHMGGIIKTVPLEEVRVKHDGVSFQIKCKQRFKDIESNVNS